ncbi:hypothetical protein KBA41_02205 [Candidatus Ozemobacteraceae bacterium]|nr:hypothetical protein [Candidatus Ozemobacteraceae bacterium]
MTLIEIMVGAVILAMIILAITNLFISGQRSAKQAMQSHQVNDEVQSAVDHLLKDVREANVLIDNAPSPQDHEPPFPDFDFTAVDAEDRLQSAVGSLSVMTRDPRNRIRLIKCVPVLPSKVSANTSTKSTAMYYIEYYFAPTDDNTVALMRKFARIRNDDGWAFYDDVPTGEDPPLDESTSISRPLISEIDTTRDYCVFFRAGSRARNVCLAAKLHRKERNADGSLVNKELYQARILVTAHIRGSAPY